MTEKPAKNGNTLSESLKNFTGLAYSQIDIISPFHLKLILRTTAEAKGNIENATSVIAVKINIAELLDKPATPVRATIEPKTNVGMYKGKTIKDNNNPPRLIPTVKAAPKAPIAESAGVPRNREANNHFRSPACNPRNKPKMGEIITSGSPVVIQ
jgi:hypothetical protein